MAIGHALFCGKLITLRICLAVLCGGEMCDAIRDESHIEVWGMGGVRGISAGEGSPRVIRLGPDVSRSGVARRGLYPEEGDTRTLLSVTRIRRQKSG